MGKQSRQNKQSKQLTKDGRRAETKLVSLAATIDSSPFRQGVERFRQTRVVYRFDADLTRSLMATDLKVMPPRTTLRHLPHDTFVITFNDPIQIWDDEDERTRAFDGVLVNGLEPIQVFGARAIFKIDGLDSPTIDTVRGTYFGSFADDGEPQIATASLPLDFSEPLDVYYDLRDEYPLAPGIGFGPTRIGHREGDIAQTTITKPLGRLLWQLLLYLSSPEPDFVAVTAEPVDPTGTSRRAAEPQVFDVGWRVGAALRKSQSTSSNDLGGGVRAHVRRGHWHTYLYGRRDGLERERRLKWVNPLIVSADGGPIVGTVFAEGDQVTETLSPEDLGDDYQAADENTAQPDVSNDDPGNPDNRGRGARVHAELQNELAQAVAKRGLDPRSPSLDDPQYDLSWRKADGTIVVVEVKSLGPTTEVSQLRLGVGQVIQYRWNLTALYQSSVEAVLFVEREPSNPDWIDLCQDEGIALAWPKTISSLFDG